MRKLDNKDNLVGTVGRVQNQCTVTLYMPICKVTIELRGLLCETTLLYDVKHGEVSSVTTELIVHRRP